ncbi:MAG: hypothetical protein HOI03_03620 [Candidatus Marinimicrobia bacterium]|jgi:hypothetical protein|nr:hypothetical protein [Candidatus Neomarinimicrobiota bacterium]
MKIFYQLTFLIIFNTNILVGDQENELLKYGFIDIKTDSLDVPFFIDGFYVGNHPLSAPIPVIPGFHEISYIPPEIQHEKVRDNLTEGIKRVYVSENDTLEVFLFYDHYLSQVENLHDEIKIQNYIGISLVTILLYVILSIF